MASDEGKALVDAKVQEYNTTLITAIMGTAENPKELAALAVAGAKADGTVDKLAENVNQECNY